MGRWHLWLLVMGKRLIEADWSGHLLGDVLIHLLAFVIWDVRVLLIMHGVYRVSHMRWRALNHRPSLRLPSHLLLWLAPVVLRGALPV